jgi:hypothetical protein
MWTAPAWANPGADPVQEVLALERQAMDGWLKGDPDPQLAISDSQITYYHAVVDKRVEGLPALKELYDRYRGTPLFDSYEMLNPKVQVAGDVAVLTYQLAQHNGSATAYWNATQVYRRKQEGWRIIHTHWSAAKARQP